MDSENMGGTFQTEEPRVYSDPVYGQSAGEYAQATVEPTQPENTGSGLAIASLIFGIIGIPASCCCGLGLLFSVIGLIFGIVGNSKHKTGVGTAGIVCNIIGIVSAVLVIVFYFILGSNGADYVNSL